MTATMANIVYNSITIKGDESQLLELAGIILGESRGSLDDALGEIERRMDNGGSISLSSLRPIEGELTPEKCLYYLGCKWDAELTNWQTNGKLITFDVQTANNPPSALLVWLHSVLGLEVGLMTYDEFYNFAYVAKIDNERSRVEFSDRFQRACAADEESNDIEHRLEHRVMMQMEDAAYMMFYHDREN